MIEKKERQGVINARALVSLLMCSSGICLVPSGIALHFASREVAARWSHQLMSMHNAAALLFAAAAIAHLILNWKVLTRYINARGEGFPKFKRELLIAVTVVSGVVLFAVSHVLHLP